VGAGQIRLLVLRGEAGLLPGRSTRHHGHAPGSGQRRTARLPPEL